MGPDGIILPATWQALIRPGMSITMTMWPMEKPAQQALPRPPPPLPPNFPVPPGGAAPTTQLPPPAPDVRGANNMSNVNATNSKSGPSKNEFQGLVGFFASKSAKKKKSYKTAFKSPKPTSPFVQEIITSTSSNSISSRTEARNAGLVIQVRRQTEKRKYPRRQPTISAIEPDPPPVERHELSSARVYPDELGPGSVALELTKYNSPPRSVSSSNEVGRITWL